MNEQEETVFVIYAGLRNRGGDPFSIFLTLPEDWESRLSWSVFSNI